MNARLHSLPRLEVLAGLTAIGVTNVIPIVGLIAWQWDAFEVALLIWLDGAIKLLMAALKLLTRPPGTLRRFQAAIGLALVNGGFMFGHLLALGVLLSGAQSKAEFLALTSALAANNAWRSCFVGIAASHLFSFVAGYLPSGMRRTQLSRLAAMEVCARVWLVQLFVGLLAMSVIGGQRSGLPALLGMVLVKTISDVYFERREILTAQVHHLTASGQKTGSAA